MIFSFTKTVYSIKLIETKYLQEYEGMCQCSHLESSVIWGSEFLISGKCFVDAESLESCQGS